MNIRIQSCEIALDAVGAGFKPAHRAEILAARPDIGFFEIHAENYMNPGGPNRRLLAAIREIFPISVHGVGLSLGSTERLDFDHLARLKEVVDFAAPALVSEHLAWSDFSGRAFPDLLPLPYDDAALARAAEKIAVVQDFLRRPILIENPATYLRFAGDALAETEFLAELCARTGCGLLLDVNNVFVSAVNHGFDARDYLDAFPYARVGEIHLAGHARARDANGAFLIDDHGGPVSEEVWALYRHVIAAAGPRPTLIEWDNNVPDWAELWAETAKARAVNRRQPLTHQPVERRASRVQLSGKAPYARQDSAWQSAFAAALQDPAAPIPPLFTPCDASARFAVYRNNSAVAAIEALKTQFPTVLRLVGDEAFRGAARAFARKIPPVSPVLAEYGEGFPDFLTRFLAEQGVTDLPYLPDVARLDWAVLQALRADEVEPCPLARLAMLDPAAIENARALLHPALALVASDWPLRALRAPEGGAIADWRGETILVLLPHAEARLVALAPGGAAFLSACGAGASLGQAAQAGLAAEPGFDFGQTLVALTEAGAFADFILEQNEKWSAP
ncbi:MNIO family bufferin maturase [Rhodoblastus sp.]|uniref:MNIO family bufferin maturase n=1 Tax=Rhodoblastus sp. TaxID=1962975 RepID=UPI003F9BFEA0